MYRQAVALRLGRCGLFSAVPDTACQKNSKNQKKYRNSYLGWIDRRRTINYIDCNHRRSLPNCTWMENGGRSLEREREEGCTAGTLLIKEESYEEANFEYAAGSMHAHVHAAYGGICGRCFGQQPAGSAGRNRQCKRWRYDHADWQH